MCLSSSVRYGWVAGLAVLTLDAVAGENINGSPNAAMRYAAVSTQSDSDHNRETTGTLSLTFGDHTWAHAGVGKIRVQQGDSTINPTLINMGAGITGQQLALTLDFGRRKDGDRYDQRDWNSSLDWHNDTLGLGIDGMHRDTDVEAVVPVASGQGTSTNVPIAESLRGNGFGLHARFNPTERLTLSLAGMHYSYDTQTRQSGAVATNSGNSGLINTIIGNALNNRPLLAQQLLLQASGVTREAAILQRSWNAGIGYRFDRVALAAQYFNDKALDSDGVINTAEVSAAIFLDKHWTVSPAIGRCHSEQQGDVTFGSLTASFGW